MALLPQPYDAGNLGLQPSETGVQSVAGAARRVGMFYNQVGEATQHFGERAGQELGSAIREAGDTAVRYLDHQQISAGAASGAQLFDNLTARKDAIVKALDPNDPHYAQKVEVALKAWRENELEPAFDTFRKGFSTEKSQDWAERFIDHTRQHMYVSSNADIATAAKIGITNSITTFVNTASNTALKDPAAMPALLDAADHSVAGMVQSSSLRGAAAGAVQSEVLEKAKAKIVKSAAFGYIQQTGQVPPWASEPKYSQYIDGIELKQLQKAAEVQTRTNLLVQRQAALTQRQLDDQQVHVATNKAFTDNVTIDPATNRPMINPKFFTDVLDVARRFPNAPNAAATVKTYLDWGEAQQRARAEPVVSDAGTKAGLISGLMDPNKPTTELDVLRAEADNKLSTRDGAILRAMVHQMGPDLTHDPIVHTAMQGAAERVGQSLLVDGHERFANFMQAFLPQYLKAKRDGTLPPNALDLRDENSLIRQSLKPFEPTAQERMLAHSMRALGGANPGALLPAAPGTAKPGTRVKQNGHTYELQADGKYKLVE